MWNVFISFNPYNGFKAQNGRFKGKKITQSMTNYRITRKSGVTGISDIKDKFQMKREYDDTCIQFET
jgi:hypothetical protein